MIKAKKKWLSYLKVILPFMPIVVVAVSIIGVQAHTNNQMEKILHFKNINGKLNWKLNGINALMQ